MSFTISNPWRDRILRGEVCSVMSVKYAISNEIAMMTKMAGMDGMFIDMEHSVLTIREVSQLVTACNYVGVSPIVRIPSKAHWHLSRILDAGAAAVVIPHCETVEQVQEIVKDAKYAPLGRRGCAGNQPILNFQAVPTAVQNDLLNRETMVIPMIETPGAVELADQFLAIPGVDGILVGSNDLCTDLEIPGQYDNPVYIDSVTKVVKAGVRANKPVGIGGIGGRLDLLEKFFEMGATWSLSGADGAMLQAGMKALGKTYGEINTRVQQARESNAAKLSSERAASEVKTAQATVSEVVAQRLHLLKLVRDAGDESKNAVGRDLNAPSVPRHRQNVYLESGVMCSRVTKTIHWRASSGIEHLKARIAQLESQETAQSAENLEPSPSTLQSHGWTSQEERAAPKNAVEYLSVAAMGEPEKRDDFNHGPSFATMVQSVAQLSVLSKPDMSVEAQEGSATMSLKNIGEELRKSCGYTLRDLAESYHKHHHPLLPCITPATWGEILDVATFLEQYHATGMTRNPILELLFYFTACLGALNTSDHGASYSIVQYLARRAVLQIPGALEDASDVDTVCCLFLASLLSLHLFDTASSWNFAGLALTKAISSGFHRASTVSETPEAHEATLILFWSLYTLDRAFAVVLDRPLSVEDGDMTIQLPLATTLLSSGQSDNNPTPMSVWITHYSNMVSNWRRLPTPEADLSTCMESLAYWRDTCREAGQPDSTTRDASDTETGQLLLTATESNLTCRALVQLFSRAILGREVPCLLPSAHAEIEIEVPRFLMAYRAALDGNVLGPNILDVWTIFGSTVVFIASSQPSMKAHLGLTVRPMFGIGVAVMRVVSTSIDLLRAIALRCHAVHDLQDVLWSYLSALESSGQPDLTQQSGTPKGASDLDASIARSRLTIPQHLQQIIHLAVVTTS